MFKSLLIRLGFGTAASLLIAVAAAAAMIAASYFLLAGIEHVVVTPVAAALTAVVLAVIIAMIVSFTPKIEAAKPTAAPQRSQVDPAFLRTVSEIGLAGLGILADLALSRRLAKTEKARNPKHRRR